MKIYEFLNDNGMKTSHFCNNVGISTTTLHNLIAGKAMPSLPTAVAIYHFTDGKVKYEDMLIESNDTAAVKHRNGNNKKKD